MCYPKPGPRCSSHAKEKLASTKHVYDRAVALQDFESFEEARGAYREAETEYDATPAGIEKLKELLTTVEHRDTSKELSSRLTTAINTRETALKAYREAIEAGTVEDTGDTTAKPAVNPGIDRVKKRHTREAIARRAEKARRTNEAATTAHLAENTTHMFSQNPVRIHNRINTAIDLEVGQHTGHHNRILSHILKLQKKQLKFETLLRSTDVPEEKARIEKALTTIQQKVEALNYDRDLLATQPEPGDHPSTLQDRQDALKRWSLISSIQNMFK